MNPLGSADSPQVGINPLAVPRLTSVEDVKALAFELSARLSAQEAGLSQGMQQLHALQMSALHQLDEVVRSTSGLATAAGFTVLLEQPKQLHLNDELHPAVIEAELILGEQRRRLGQAKSLKSTEGRTERRLVFWLTFAVFVVLGYITAERGGLIPGDAMSRIGSGQSVLFSRDPHLEAIGFIWGPFPTLFQLPVIALRNLWLPLTSSGMAAVIVSAAFMAGTLRQLIAWGIETGTSGWFRIAAVVIVAAHPLIWTHGSNGMSEACWLFFLMVAARHLARWIETDDIRSLVMVAVAIAAGYLTRYETAAVFAAVFAVVGVVTWHNSARYELTQRTNLQRSRETMLDLTILSFPVIIAMLAWAGASWAITGEPFPQFTSAYGNSALVARAATDTVNLIGDPSIGGRGWFFIRQLMVVSPFLVVLALIALWGSRRACLRATAAIAVLGSPLVLQLLFAMRGSTFPWIRYVTVGVVLAAVLAMVVASSSNSVKRSIWLQGVVLALLVPGVLCAAQVVRSQQYASFDQTDSFDALAKGLRGESVVESRSLSLTGISAADDIDALPDVEAGTILMDQAGIGVLPAAPKPNVYVIPSDRDFGPALADPEVFGIRYLLLIESGGADQVGAQYPDMFENDGGSFATQVGEWGSDKEPKTHLRLFKLTNPEPVNRPKPDLEFGT